MDLTNVFQLALFSVPPTGVVLGEGYPYPVCVPASGGQDTWGLQLRTAPDGEGAPVGLPRQELLACSRQRYRVVLIPVPEDG